MLLIAKNDGSAPSASLESTGTMTIESGIIGGVLITADGTNDATITVQRNDANGKTVFDLVTKSPAFIVAPVSLESTTQAYYSVTGTGAAAQFFEWVE